MIGTHILGFCVRQLNVGAKLTSFFKCREVELIESNGREGGVVTENLKSQRSLT